MAVFQNSAGYLCYCNHRNFLNPEERMKPSFLKREPAAALAPPPGKGRIKTDKGRTNQIRLSAFIFSLKRKFVFFIGIDNRRIKIAADPAGRRIIGKMNMPVNEECRPVLFHQGPKGLKACVGQTASIAQMKGRGVGDQDVKAFMTGKLKPEAHGPLLHLIFRILIGTALIAHGTAQPQKTDPTVHIYLILDGNTALRRFLLIAAVVIPMDIEDRPLKKVARKER